MVIPILLAVPATMLIAFSISKAFKSLIFPSAISRTLSQDNEATFLRLGCAEPDLIFAASKS